MLLRFFFFFFFYVIFLIICYVEICGSFKSFGYIYIYIYIYIFFWWHNVKNIKLRIRSTWIVIGCENQIGFEFYTKAHNDQTEKKRPNWVSHVKREPNFVSPFFGLLGLNCNSAGLFPSPDFMPLFR